MNKYFALLFLMVPILMGTTCKYPANVVFDESHDPLHTIADPSGYGPLADVIIDEGHTVSAWDTIGDWGNLNSDVDIIVVALPQQLYNNALILPFLKAWVEDGGVLLIIADHPPYTAYLKPLAEYFGASFIGDYIVHDGASHCPPGESTCPIANFSFTSSTMAGVMEDVPWVTTYTGTAIFPLDGVNLNPIFQYSAPASTFTTECYTQIINGHVYSFCNNGFGDVSGLFQMASINVGSGMVVISSESGMWTCRFNPLPTGWCDTEFGLHNEQFVRNIFAIMSRVRPLSEL